MKTLDQLIDEIYDIIDDCEENNGNWCPNGTHKGLASRKIAAYVNEYANSIIDHCVELTDRHDGSSVGLSNKISELHIN